MTHAARSKMIVLRLLNSVRYRSDRHPLVNPGISHAGCGGDFPASERRRVQAGEEGLDGSETGDLGRFEAWRVRSIVESTKVKALGCRQVGG